MHSSAYYLAGYAVECGLKACIAKLMKSDEFPDKEFAKDCYTHELPKMVRLGQLDQLLKSAADANTLFGNDWATTKDWNEQCRYEVKTAADAHEFFQAITNPIDGVLPWIKTYW